MNASIDLVRASYRGLDPAAILEKPTSVLLGVSETAYEKMQELGIDTIFDLAGSELFSNARELCLLAENRQGRFSTLGRIPNDILRDGNDLPLTELIVAPISRLASRVSSTKMDELAAALDVNSIYDLAFWPPYDAARELLDQVYNPLAVPGIFDTGTPSDLLPANGEYPTERVQYEVLLFDEFVGRSNVKPPRPLSDEGALDVTQYLSDSVGYERPAIGGLLTFTQSWYTKGLSLGHLIHGIALGPGETTKIAMIDWTRLARTFSSENITETEQLFSDLSRARTINEITHAVARETQQGRSAAHSEANASQLGEATGSAQLRDFDITSAFLGQVMMPGAETSGTSFGSASGLSDATSWSTSSGLRDIGASLAQNIADLTHQEAHSERNRRASIVREVSQQESETISTRTLTNYNHMHSLTVEYYEVVQLYRTLVELTKADRCIFVPMKLVDFRNLNVIDRYRVALANAALSPIVRQVLELPAATTRIQAPAIQTSELSVGQSNSSNLDSLPQDKWVAQDIYNAQAASGGQIRVLNDGRLALPSDAVLSDVDFVIRNSTSQSNNTNAAAFFVGSATIPVSGMNETSSMRRIQKGSRVRVTSAGRVTFGSPDTGTEGSFFTGQRTIKVNAADVVNPGLRIQRGSTVRVQGTGNVHFNRGDRGFGYDADGISDAANAEWYANGLRQFSLVCNIGVRWYQGGINRSFVAIDDGNLILQANDKVGEENLNDNWGEWEVALEVIPPAGTITETSFDASGDTTLAGTDFFAPNLRAYSLICRVGTRWFQGGTSTEFIADEDGELIMRANDIVNKLAPNTGNWQVTLDVSSPAQTTQNSTTPSLIITRRDGGSVTISVSAGGVSLGNDSVRVDNIDTVTILVPDARSSQFGFLAATFRLQNREFRLVFPVQHGTGSTATVFSTEVPADLISHFMDNKIYYSQVVWRSLNPATIGILLSGYTWQIGGRARPLVEIVDPSPVAIVANYLVLRISGDDATEYDEWLDRKRIRVGSWREDQIPVPTGGVFAEAVLGRSNSAEKLDITRFWDWQESPIPIQAPDIAAIQAGSRRDTDTTVPGQLGQPVLNIVNPPALPDPQGMGAILTAIQNGNMFRDMSGLAATIGLAQSGLTTVSREAEAAAAQAGMNAAVAAQFGAKVAEIAGKVIGAYLSRGSSFGAGGGGDTNGIINAAKGNSKSGEVLNYARDMDNRGVPLNGENTTSPANEQTNPGTSTEGSGTWEGGGMNSTINGGTGMPSTALGNLLDMILGATGRDAGSSTTTSGTRDAGTAIPWRLTGNWSETVPGRDIDYKTMYNEWVSNNYKRFDGAPCLCNWYPLLLLTEYAADNGLRLRLNYWQGTASIQRGATRTWDRDHTFTLDSHGGEYKSKEAFYLKARSTVTAEMISKLNTVGVQATLAKPGDLITYDYGDRFWHVEVIVEAQPNFAVESGSVVQILDAGTPDAGTDAGITMGGRAPQTAHYTYSAIPNAAVDHMPRRWMFSNFDQ